jgi:ankyrin repeat protein
MDVAAKTHLPFDAGIEAYRTQAEALMKRWRDGDKHAIEIVRQNLPLFLDDKIPWLPKQIPESELLAAPFDFADAQLALARWYSFADWSRLEQWVAAVSVEGSDVRRFESAVEAVVSGDARTLDRLLREDPDLIRMRSTRVTPHDPPMHRATLLHYIGANGVEGHRQKTPPNAVEVATMLLRAGAEVDALADMYGGACTTMSMLVSSCHPAQAGLQVALVETLLDFGAALEDTGSGKWTSPLNTALAFGYADAAAALVRRGAQVNTLPAAAGLGRLREAIRLLPAATAEDRHRALALSAQHGHAEIVRLLLDAGEDPNRYNPDGNHSHSTPLHQATLAGHIDVVKLLLDRGARMDVKDSVWQSTPLGWAEYQGRTVLAEYLRSRGAS